MLIGDSLVERCCSTSGQKAEHRKVNRIPKQHNKYVMFIENTNHNIWEESLSMDMTTI